MHVVIVGASLAGASAAVALRETGFDGRVTLLGDEPAMPFGRPPLSKSYLRGEEDLSAWEVRSIEWYAAHDVDLRTSTVVQRVDPANRRVILADGTEITCDRVLIATGCRARVPRVPGVDLDGIEALRTTSNSDAIRAHAMQPGAHCVVVGMGFIGSEVAASLRQLGSEVTAIFPGKAPLDRVLGDEVARRMAAIHRTHGVALLPNERIAAFEGDHRVERVVTESGTKIDCTFAVLGLGVEPNVEVLDGSGVGVGDGVLVDAQCRSTADGVFAAGDVARHDHPIFGPIRVEHYNNAEKQGRHVARAMLGDIGPYDYVHSFWSDQYDDKLEYVGYAETWDRFVVREDSDDAAMLGFYLTDGVLVAAVGLNRGGDPEAERDAELAAYARLIRRRARPDVGLLARASPSALG